MNNKITILDELTVNKIAAGEVVEKPSSVVKELVENAIDAKSRQISIEIIDGGKELIKISDDGAGINGDDISLAFTRHATSKINTIDDIQILHTNGFRGEALSSISSVSKVEIVTNTSNDLLGKKAVIVNSKVESIIDVGARKGTTISIKNLFYNTPARKKFLKTGTRETSAIIDIMNRLALINSDIRFKFTSDGKNTLNTEGDSSLLNAIRTIYGKSISNNLIEVNFENENVKIFGYISNTSLYASNRKKQNIFINKRYVKLNTLNYVIENVYKGIIPIGKYPVFVLDVEILPELIDPNVHPAKIEVKIDKDVSLDEILTSLIKASIFKASRNLIPEFAYKPVKNEEVENRNEAQDSKRESYSQKNEGDSVLREVFSPNTPSAKLSVESTESKFVYQESDVIEEQIIKHDKVDRYKDIEVPFSRLLENMTHPKSSEEITRKETAEEIAEVETEQGREAVVHEQLDFENNIQKNNAQNVESTKNIEEVNGMKEDVVFDYNKFHPAGVVFETYIVATYDGDMYLIDQHAAHERVMYEKFMNQYDLNKLKSSRNFESQELLIPIIKDLTMDEYNVVLENIGLFGFFGLEVEDFGYGKIVLRSLPLIFNSEQTEAFLEELIELIAKERKIDLNDKFRDKLATMACKKAVKANQKIEPAEIKNLLEKLNKCENKYTCPHGRPIFVRFTKYEIEKMFKRINA
ncbi:MAG: DNA mismatch repair endonuclease MutL [Proteocatella sp.]